MAGRGATVECYDQLRGVKQVGALALAAAGLGLGVWFWRSRRMRAATGY